MPEEIEETLRKEAQEKFPGDIKQQDKYVYGTIANMRHKGILPSAHVRKDIPSSARVKARKIFTKKII